MTNEGNTSGIDKEKIEYDPEEITPFFKGEDHDSANEKSESIWIEKKKSIWIEKKRRHFKHIELSKVSVYDVAKYILDKLGMITTMKLQKLVYYSQAWSLVWDEAPLYEEEIQAWSNGPVIPKLYYYHRGNYYITNLPLGKLTALTSSIPSWLGNRFENLISYLNTF